jgi:hypothetical protein
MEELWMSLEYLTMTKMINKINFIPMQNNDAARRGTGDRATTKAAMLAEEAKRWM